jgi:hypothetical protein
MPGMGAQIGFFSVALQISGQFKIALSTSLLC